MKTAKRFLSVLALTVLSVAFSFAGENEYFGGFWNVSGGVFYFPQEKLSEALKSAGYNGYSGLTYGMQFGGGGVFNNFYFGGWGFYDFNSEEMVNDSVSRTLTRETSSRGGFEMGYAVFNNEWLHLIPSVSFIWGGIGFDFATNVSFSDYLNDPVEYSPGFWVNYFSIGLGLNTQIQLSPQLGLLLKAVYLYTPDISLNGAHFSGTPEFNQHSVLITAGVTFGRILTKKEFAAEEQEKRDAVTNQ